MSLFSFLSSAVNDTGRLFDRLEGEGGYDLRKYVYPEDLEQELSGVGHYILININQSDGSKFTGGQPSAISNSPISDSPVREGAAHSTRDHLGASGTTKRISTMIALYMPDNVGASYSSSWENTDVNFGVMAGKALSMYDAIQNMDGSYFADGAGDLLNKFSTEEKARASLTNAGRDLFLGSDTEIGRALQARFRTLRNPHMEFLFKGVDARTFTFEFKFTPRSKAEAQAVKDIIKQLKFHSAPEIKTDNTLGIFYTYPSEFDITFISNGVENSYLSKISTCALSKIDVNYTGSGVWSAFRDDDGNGSPPTHTTVSLTFQELELLTKKRIEEGF